MKKLIGLVSVLATLSSSSLARADCSKDSDCKGARVCEQGRCVSPPPAAPPPPPPLPMQPQAVVVNPGADPMPAGSPEMPIDGVRVRGGVAGGGGFLWGSGNGSSFIQPAINISGRVGVQINHLFSLYYQAALVIAILTDGSGVFVTEMNSILANFTIAHHVDIGIGPSVGYLSVTASDGSSASGVAFGGHARAAYNFGTLGTGPRRRGVSLGLDVHPFFGDGAVLVSVALGVGYEWY